MNGASRARLRFAPHPTPVRGRSSQINVIQVRLPGYPVNITAIFAGAGAETTAGQQ
jgi:hypothetical protein